MDLKERLQSSILLKVALIGFLLLVLLIPIFRVESLTEEREQRRGEAVAEIASKWGQSQTLVGPALVVPYSYRSTIVEENREGRSVERVVTNRANAVFLPEELRFSGDIEAERRSRGIFETALYQTDLEVRAVFHAADVQRLHPGATPDWSKARLVLGLSDPIGVQAIAAQWNGQNQSVEPAGSDSGFSDAGVYISAPSMERGGIYQAKLKLRGSAELLFAPAGRNTQIELRSPWPDPAFSGASLPNAREVSAQGFSASWQLAHFSRNVPQAWAAGGEENIGRLRNAASGVRLILTADIYQKTLRALKYAFLFIGLTFAAFFLFEIFFQLRIHPFQYLLVGAAMIVFYTLFLALSEQI